MLETSSANVQPPRKAQQQPHNEEITTSTGDFVASQRKRAKTDPFSKEAQLAQKQKEEIEMKKREREESETQRKQKIAEREKMRAAMAKARKPGKNGQRKLGRESVLLLEKVKKMVQGG
jgi:hypothetical protein